MVPKQPRVNVYLTSDDYEFFKEWAESERRSMGNLAAYIITEAITQKREQKGLTKQPTLFKEEETIFSLVQANLTKLKKAGLKNLEAIARGEVLPTRPDFWRIAAELGLDEEQQKILWRKTFGNHSSQEVANGEPT